MRVLALEPYYGGSHRAFLDGWMSRSRHDWTLLTLPPAKWKWRMRHAGVSFAGRAASAAGADGGWDVLFCSDMLDLAQFRGLAPETVRGLPAVVYFHENQLTYPVEHPSEFDYHFAFTNMTTALAATRCWFNSAFHRDEFLDALSAFLKRMPDHRPLDAVEAIRARSEVAPPGVPPGGAGNRDPAAPLHVLWAARWEYDKAPAVFFEAVDRLAGAGVDFRLSVIGGGDARAVPQDFARARARHVERVVHWGYQSSRAAYEQVLGEADVVVSTADHEFFGIGMVEAAAWGAFLLLPRRLAYPEVFGDLQAFFYDGGSDALARRLAELAGAKGAGRLWPADPERGRRIAARYAWDVRAPELDRGMRRLAGRPGGAA
jgi:glycosyltransferase involved in cell wall biosynthesis